MGENPLPDHQPDLSNGELLVNAGGCSSCHGSVDQGKPDRQRLGGGLELVSPVGAFYVPNISSHPEDGIGGWTATDFLNAMQKGVSPSGKHYYPSFPYTSYARMKASDLLDMQAWLAGLPPVAGKAPDHQLSFPWSFRPAIGIWKRLFLNRDAVVDLSSQATELRRGQYLVEGPGHCGECHTPRNFAQAMDVRQWLAGAPDPGGEGRVPNLVEGLEDWTADDIAYYLETGMDPDYDAVGGDMVSVQENISRLPDSDRDAIGKYLKALGSGVGERLPKD